MESKTLPATPPKGKTEINKIFEALSLMNSMIIGGEPHSPVSKTLYEEATQSLALLGDAVEMTAGVRDEVVAENQLYLRTTGEKSKTFQWIEDKLTEAIQKYNGG